MRESGLTNVQIDTLAMARNLCTYDALHELKKKYHQDDARFVIGMDKLPELPRWAHARDAAARVHVYPACLCG